MMKRRLNVGMFRVAAVIAATCLAGLSSQVVFAQGAAGYPSKPITMITLTAPGGSLDILSRSIANSLQKQMGQPVVVENRVGAGGNIGVEALSKAAPDGYTIGMVTSSTHGSNPSLYGSNLRFDAVKDFAPIILAARLNNVVVVNASLPIHDIPELVAYARAHPDAISFGSAGTGTSQHLAGEMLKLLANIKMTHVPYRGAAQAVPDLLAGQVQLMFSSIPDVIAHIQSGKLRVIGVTGAQRARAFPDAVPIAEQGYPGFDMTAWFGVSAPARTPQPIIDKLNREIASALAAPELQQKLISLGMDPATSTPEAFASFINDEIVKWGKVVQMSGAKLE